MKKRKSMRLKNYDYSQNAMYFITICTTDRKNLLWIEKSKCRGEQCSPGNIVQLSKYGKIVDFAIKQIQIHYNDVFVTKYVIMPNHIHLIICLQGNDGRTLFAPTISRIIKQMKEYVTKQIGISIWQRSFRDEIIRNEQMYQKVWTYIDNNPLKWELDCYYNK